MKFILLITILVWSGCEESTSPQESSETRDAVENTKEETTTVTDENTPTEQNDSLTNVFAKADMQAINDSGVDGQVTFGQSSAGELLVQANLSGAKADSTHGFHIHETGDCSREGEAAGGHYNPTGTDHGTIGTGHIGDLGNLVFDGNGKVTDRKEKPASTAEDFSQWEQIIGKAVILHSGADDMTSQPAGNAGARIACGIIVEADQASAH